MALGVTWSVAVSGVGGQLVEIEADVGRGLPGLGIVGLGDTALLQARDRIRAATTNSGLAWPSAKIVLSLSPASLPKRGSGFDLALTAGVLAATGQIPPWQLRDAVLLGELALDGRLRPVRGVLPAVAEARARGLGRVIVPAENLAEAALVEGIETLGAENLGAFAGWCRGTGALCDTPDEVLLDRTGDESDLADVTGQPGSRRAVEVAAAGGHALLLRGAPGTGKTMLARRLPGLLPDLTHAQSLEVTAIHSVLGKLSPDRPLITRPPFESPHHTASVAALVGGGTGTASPGAVSSAHHGVLFLDECPEFTGRTLESLRTLVEDGYVLLARRDAVTRFPARFQLVLAANDCPCGVARPVDCTCTSTERRRYAGRLSGPLMDRVDISTRTEPVGVGMLADPGGEPTAEVAERVARARSAAAERWAALDGGRNESSSMTNASVPPGALHGEASLPPSARRPLDRALHRGLLSGRGVDRCLRVSWTLADLAGRSRPDADHVAEALILRNPEETW